MFHKEQAGIRLHNFPDGFNVRSWCFLHYIELFDSSELTKVLADGQMPAHPIKVSAISFAYGALFCTFSQTMHYLAVRVQTVDSTACEILINSEEIIILVKNDIDVTEDIVNDIEKKLTDQEVRYSTTWY